MAFTEKQAAFRYINEYQKKKYDRITILRKAGEKQKLDAIAKENGLTLSAFINKCVDEKLKAMGKALDS